MIFNLATIPHSRMCFTMSCKMSALDVNHYTAKSGSVSVPACFTHRLAVMFDGAHSHDYHLRIIHPSRLYNLTVIDLEVAFATLPGHL